MKHTNSPSLQVEQGSDEWHEDRRCNITGSNFHKVLTPPKTKVAKAAGEMGATSRSYMMDLLAEHLTGLPTYVPTTQAMQWGHDHEADAAAVYEAVTDTVSTEVGFVTHPGYPNVGCSPDRLVGDDGGLEIKCPFCTRIHLEYRLAGVVPKDHIAQVQGALWVTGRKWWDFVSYDKRMPNCKLALFRVRVYPDLEYIERLERAIVSFRDELAATLAELTGGTK